MKEVQQDHCVQQMHPIALLLWSWASVRRLEVAALIDASFPPHPPWALVWAWGRSLGIAILDGHHASTSGETAEERGCWRCCSRGSRVPRSIFRWGTSSMRCLPPISTRCLCRCSQSAGGLCHLNALAASDTTTIALYGGLCGRLRRPRAPRPAYGHSKMADDLKQVLLSLGVSGDGGSPYGWAYGMAPKR